MSIAMNFDVESKDLEETLRLGAKIGANLKGNEFIELRGDIGSGKTALVRGIAKGAGSDDEVASPSFTLSRVYKGQVSINHYDFYRLDDPGIMKMELAESISSDEVNIIEWADAVKGVLPEEKLIINIKNAENENTRVFTFVFTERQEYLVEGIKS